MGATVAVVNQKGGVGKTTVVLGLASAAQAAGDRVLVVDNDPQASATWALGIEPESVEAGSSSVTAANRVGAAAKALLPSAWGPEVDVLPATADLLMRDTDLHVKEPTLRLRKALQGVTDDYELTLVDCAPNLGLTTIGALSAADLALLVVEPAALSLRGLAAVSDAIDHVWEAYNPGLDIAGVVVNRRPPRSAEADRQEAILVRNLGRRAIWEPSIPQRVVITQAVDERRPLHGFGWQAADAIAVFDALYARLRRAARRRARA